MIFRVPVRMGWRMWLWVYDPQGVDVNLPIKGEKKITLYYLFIY